MDQDGVGTRTAFRYANDDALLLHEFSHRTANEIASASAALRLAKGTLKGGGAQLVDRAIDRLDAFAELNRVLARPVHRQVDVSTDLVTICRAIASGATSGSRSVMSLDVPQIWVTGCVARRMTLVAAELVSNAVRHALEGRRGRLVVSLGIVDEDIVLEVSDDGPGMRAGASTARTGLGSGIVAELVERGGGALAITTGRKGTKVRVALPLVTPFEEDDDEDVPF